jgi:hypothetical protein
MTRRSVTDGWWRLGVITASVLVAVACGDDDGSDPGDTTYVDGCH